MKRSTRDEAPDVFIDATFADPELARRLVLKGARALPYLGVPARPTKDVDLTARHDAWQDTEDIGKELKDAFATALRNHCDRSAYEWSVYAVSIARKPTKERLRGWSTYVVKATLQLRGREQVIVEADISFGDLTEGTIRFVREAGGPSIVAYSREQMIAEKLRAFLQSLPPNKTKVAGHGHGVPRVRDLGDVAALLACGPIDLHVLGSSLSKKCVSKYVDFESIDDLLPPGTSVAGLARLYRDDPRLFTDPFEDVWKSVESLVGELAEAELLPGRTPLGPIRPDDGSDDDRGC